MNELEEKLYDMVVKRFLAVFYPSAEFQQTTRITRVEGEAFKSEGKVLVNPGWFAVYGKEADTEETGNLTPVAAGENRRRAKSPPRSCRPSRLRATPRRRCCRQWKVRAS